MIARRPDNIGAKLLKLAPAEVSQRLTIIFKNSMRNTGVPEDWKTANITPIFKKGDRSDPRNYRPVSITSITCKLLEHIIKSAIYSHLETFQIITDKQHGFRKKYSCTSQLLMLVNSLAESINSRSQTDVIFLDFSKAFDKVSPINYYSNYKVTVYRDKFFCGLKIFFVVELKEL